ncbi:hypothetical protein [Human papillomavirus type 41]|uniref:Replication protein E1 n=1 Tax=Human papillomavirus type 41 TaxID=10589 RepID=VE1_HPV41|nr:hypothetical protein [Human papillomavirus type 41]P27551.1 RecName: Full=Replication protein E1; AltName: Full=ATP-dependent helicase E1 [Human papillomavirus type 41]CAA39614.1 ORF E1 [Human papillomavirus type 41]
MASRVSDTGNGNENKENEGTVASDHSEARCSYILFEAECSDGGDDEESMEDSLVEDLVDDASVHQGNSLSLFHAQTVEEYEGEIQSLKRKFILSPLHRDVAELSPRLAGVSLEENRGKKARKSLFHDDSGIDSSAVEVSQLSSTPSAPGPDIRLPKPSDIDLEPLFQSRQRCTHMYSKFKAVYGVSFTDITRPFKSDKTTSQHWVVAAYYLAFDSEISAMEVLLRQQCQFLYIDNNDGIILFFLEYNVQKSRTTVYNWFTANFHYNENRMLANPPRTRNMPAALFFYHRFMGTGGIKHGAMPEIIVNQCVVSNQQTDTFELSRMVQWALDNDLQDEHMLALEYALLAESDGNARAFLKQNNQPMIVKNCSIMVRHYKTALVAKMSISQYVNKRCLDHGEADENSWRGIVHFLRYQGQEFLPFMCKMHNFLHHRPKKSTLVLCGPSDTGKSYFANGLNKFLDGHVLSFVSNGSHFWLSPLRGARCCLIDDATLTFWRYADQNMRALLDGYEISIDAKHRNPMQTRAPPLIITTNEDIMRLDEFKYLQTRTMYVYFNKPFPLKGNGQPLYYIDGYTWNSFFRKFWRHLNLKDPEDESDGETPGTIRLYTRADTDTI